MLGGLNTALNGLAANISPVASPREFSREESVALNNSTTSHLLILDDSASLDLLGYPQSGNRGIASNIPKLWDSCFFSSLDIAHLLEEVD